MCLSTKSTLEWSVSGEFLRNEREEEREDMNTQGDEDEKRQINRETFRQGVSGKRKSKSVRKSKVERGRQGEEREERWAGPGWGQGCQEKRQTDRQTGHPGPKQNFSCPAMR